MQDGIANVRLAGFGHRFAKITPLTVFWDGTIEKGTLSVSGGLAGADKRNRDDIRWARTDLTRSSTHEQVFTLLWIVIGSFTSYQ